MPIYAQTREMIINIALSGVQFWTPTDILHSKQQKNFGGMGKKLCLFCAKSGLQDEVWVIKL